MSTITYDGNRLVLQPIQCNCGLEHGSPNMDIYIGQDILAELPEYLDARSLGRNVTLITDNVVHPIAGKPVLETLQAAGFTVKLCLLERQDILLPNEAALGEVLLTMDANTDFLLSVGAGTLTDIARYTAIRTGKPFACVGTAASMDGYTSVVAPLLHGQQKVNKPAGYPEVLVCDLTIMKDAPLPMMIAGFGDVVGKYIAKADWILGSIVNGEILCPACLGIIDEALEHCTAAVEGIRAGQEEAVQRLIEGLVLAGLTILVVGHTRAVASIEHNMGHFWEMIKLQRGEEHASHGTAVGTATGYVLCFYEKFFQRDFSQVDWAKVKAHRPTIEQREERVLDAYGRRVGQQILAEPGNELISWEEQKRRVEALHRNMDEIRSSLAFLPSTADVHALYDRLGAPKKAEEIGIDQALLRSALLYAKDYRDRYSVFHAAAELGILEELVEEVIEAMA